jgi:hypothetical protein
LAKYAHRFSPKKFTQPQLFACLVLKEFQRWDYRKLQKNLLDSPEWVRTLQFKKVPHFTTFQKASKRLLRSATARRLLDKTIRYAGVVKGLPKHIDLAALDGTGFESQHASSYYVSRRAKGSSRKQKMKYSRFPKAGILCDCQSHLILAVVPGQGPGPDILHFQEALVQALGQISIKTLAADAGYDAEWVHQFSRTKYGVRTLIPATIGRPTSKPPGGYWRRQMTFRIQHSRYGQRWQVETVNSMLKRLLDSFLRARTYWSRLREIFLKAITLNIMILWYAKLFYRADLSPFLVAFSGGRSRRRPGRRRGCRPPRRAGGR